MQIVFMEMRMRVLIFVYYTLLQQHDVDLNGVYEDKMEIPAANELRMTKDGRELSQRPVSKSTVYAFF